MIDNNDWYYNTTPHSSNNTTPYKLVYGREANLPSAIKLEDRVFYNADDYLVELKQRLKRCREYAQENIIKCKKNSKTQYDKIQTL